MLISYFTVLPKHHVERFMLLHQLLDRMHLKGSYNKLLQTQCNKQLINIPVKNN